MPKIDFSLQTQYSTVPSSKIPSAVSYTAYCVNMLIAMCFTAMCHGDGRLYALWQFNGQWTLLFMLNVLSSSQTYLNLASRQNHCQLKLFDMFL